jgi:CBS domain-containing protein
MASNKEEATMSVAKILAEKGREVVTMRADQTLGDAVSILRQHRIGAVVVLGDGESVAGIISERDVVRALGDHGADALSLKVDERMTRKVATCAPTAALPELMALMTDGKFRHVPVVKDGRLDGMVSIGDLVKYRLAEMEAEQQALKDYIGAA